MARTDATTPVIIPAPLGRSRGYDHFARPQLTMKPLIVAGLIILVCALLFFQPGSFLIVNNPEKSDALVVLWGDQAGTR